MNSSKFRHGPSFCRNVLDTLSALRNGCTLGELSDWRLLGLVTPASNLTAPCDGLAGLGDDGPGHADPRAAEALLINNQNNNDTTNLMKIIGR